MERDQVPVGSAPTPAPPDIRKLEDSNAAWLKLWTLRILVRLNGYATMADNLFADASLLASIGLAHVEQPESKLPERIALLREELERCERASLARPGDTLWRNVEQLRAVVGLSELERDILWFTLLMKNVALLEKATRSVGDIPAGGVAEVLCAALRRELTEVRRALRSDGLLAQSGLVRVDVTTLTTQSFGLRVDLMDDFPELVLNDHASPLDMLSAYFRPARAARLASADFPHAVDDLALLGAYLKSVGRDGTPGVNVLIYGQPGVGKTELVRAITSESGLALFEVVTERRSGGPLSGDSRFAAFRLGQLLLKGQPGAALLFDEVEDVFRDHETGFGFDGHRAQMHKGWMNTVLEQNPVPAFWVSNKVQHIDPAFLRRFDYAFELRPPTRAVRARVIGRLLEDLDVSEAWIERVADHPDVMPAHIERAAKVARATIAAAPDSIRSEQAIDRVLGNTLAVLGRAPVATRRVADEVFDPCFLNADANLVSIVKGIVATGHGRLCLYGPPGTGKTSFAAYLAGQLGRPLLVKRGSDLLRGLVGETEKQIAEAFRAAQAQGAVLVIDEADSFLYDRRGSVRTWEVTLVNEMLVRLEEFEGVFVASTNLPDQLDRAALRRFDFKVRFDYLQAEQAWRMLERTTERLGWADPAPALRARLGRLTCLTPGEFANAERQTRIAGHSETPEGFVALLERECQTKTGNRSTVGIGFLAHRTS